MSAVRDMPAPSSVDAEALRIARIAARTAARKASCAQTKAERLARRQRYRAVCFFNPARVTMKEEPSWS
jgi:hypothetical protein